MDEDWSSSGVRAMRSLPNLRLLLAGSRTSGTFPGWTRASRLPSVRRAEWISARSKNAPTGTRGCVAGAKRLHRPAGQATQLQLDQDRFRPPCRHPPTGADQQEQQQKADGPAHGRFTSMESRVTGARSRSSGAISDRSVASSKRRR